MIKTPDRQILDSNSVSTWRLKVPGIVEFSPLRPDISLVGAVMFPNRTVCAAERQFVRSAMTFQLQRDQHCQNGDDTYLPGMRRRGHGAGRNYERRARSVERVIRAMIEHLEGPMTNEELSDIACFSPFHFNRLFHSLTGIPPIKFHYALRLEQAKRLLATTDRSVIDICFDVGYNSLGTFTTRFNELVGLSPTAYRRFSRQVSSIDLKTLRPILSRAREKRSVRNHIFGKIRHLAPFDGIVFIGLFRRGIPEGQPVACTLAFNEDTYAISIPSDGQWFVLSAAVPWMAGGTQLLTLEGMPRGRTGVISSASGRWAGESEIVLMPPCLLDPPILAVMPLLLGRLLAVNQPPASAGPANDHMANLTWSGAGMHPA